MPYQFTANVWEFLRLDTASKYDVNVGFERGRKSLISQLAPRDAWARRGHSSFLRKCRRPSREMDSVRNMLPGREPWHSIAHTKNKCSLKRHVGSSRTTSRHRQGCRSRTFQRARVG
jgi:hypothetical protein